MSDEAKTIVARRLEARAAEAKPPEPPPPPPKEKTDVFKNGVIIMLTLISIFVALVTYLQNDASLNSEDLVQRSEFRAVDSTGEYFRVGLDAAQGMAAQQRYADYVQRQVRADLKARALRLGGYPELATDNDQDAERWRTAAADLLVDMNTQYPDLSEYGDSLEVYRESLSRSAYLKNEHQYVLLAQSRAWSRKANGYVAVLSTLSVALFLGGLSLTLGSRVRYLLGASSVALTGICFLWTLVIAFSSVPTISDAALEQFVDGQIGANIANDRGEDPVEAIADFDKALALAPNYARAYVFRSFANTDSSLADLHLDTAQAIADMERAIDLGEDSDTAYTNLGWLYYLNGQYDEAVRASQAAVDIENTDCFAEFNLGLTLLAMGKTNEGNTAYGNAIACAHYWEATDESWAIYYLDVGVVDLEDLRAAHPELTTQVDSAIQRLKSASATLTLFGVLEPRETSASLSLFTFGENTTNDNRIESPAESFPQTTQTVYASFEYEGMTPETRWLERWLRDGREDLVIPHDTWEGGETGTWFVGIYNGAGLTSGEYELDIFIEGNLLATGRFTVEAGNLPPMTSYDSTDVGVTINYPLDWNLTDLADNEVSVVGARDPNRPNAFAVTAWQASTGTDQDIFDLFDFNFSALDERYANFSSQEAESFRVAGREGWISYYEYIDDVGQPIYGAVVGVQNDAHDLTFMLMIETHADEWDAQLDLINVMLSRIEIDE